MIALVLGAGHDAAAAGQGLIPAKLAADGGPLLDGAGLPYEIDTTLVRGLDYSTRTLFEFTSGVLGAQSAGELAGGGQLVSGNRGGECRERDRSASQRVARKPQQVRGVDPS